MTTDANNGYEDYQGLSVELDAGIAWVTIDNGPVNLFDALLYASISRLGPQLAGDDRVRVVVLQSANPEFFIAHFDVGLILTIPTELPEPNAPTAFHAMCETFRTMPKATIVKLEGRVGGGGAELAASCDMRFAAIGRAVLNQPEVALGIIPGGSGTQRLPRLIGRSRALEVVLGCEDFDALAAERYGWVNRAVPADEIGQFVERLARRIASFPPMAVAAAKASVLEHDGDLQESLRQEGARFNRTLADPVARSAMQRFLHLGGQTVDGELELGALAARLGTPPT